MTKLYRAICLLCCMSVSLALSFAGAAAQEPTLPGHGLEELLESTSESVDTSQAQINPPSIPPGAQPVEIPDERLDAALAALNDDGLQTERPERAPEPRPPLRQRRQPSSNGIAQFFATLFSAIGPIVFWSLAAAFAGLILWAIYLMFGESLTLRRKEKQPGSEQDISIAPDLMPDQSAARALLLDAEALAARGQFAEAVHALLFRSIDHIQERQPRDVKNSLTAREIGKLSTLPDLIRKGLSPIITIVERSYFGGQAVDETGWIEARDAYRSFALREAGI